MPSPLQIKAERTYRMYGFVPYNISEIQKGIQFGHAVVEYALMYNDWVEYQKWAKKDKTFVILNGGTTNTNESSLGSMNMLKIDLSVWKIKYAAFYEPDLGDQLTALCFLVDERVFDRELYPEYDEYVNEGQAEWDYYESIWGDEWRQILDQREFLAKFKLA